MLSRRAAWTSGSSTSPRESGIEFRHNSGAYGGKLLPETLGSGCAFLDFDGDGWQDILLVNGMDWKGHTKQRSTLRLYRNNRNGTFSDVTRQAGLDVEMYGMGVAVGDWNNDGFPDLLVTCVGQNRLFRNTGKGTFVDVTKASGLAGRTGVSTSAIWFDFDRDGWLDLFVCNYVGYLAAFGTVQVLLFKDTGSSRTRARVPNWRGCSVSKINLIEYNRVIAQ